MSRTLSYLDCARHGLAEDEILDILSPDKEVMADFQRRSPNSPKVDSLPVAVWVRLHGDLAFYLAEHQAQGASLLGFYHRSFLEAATTHCFASRETRETRHQHMSVYFLACAKGLDPAGEWETDAVRGFAECVFHLVKAGQHERATALLTSFPFLLHKLRVGLLQGVFEDYDLVQVGRDRRARRTSDNLDVWADFFREKAHILRRGNEEWPAHKILLQVAVEHADDSPLTLAAEQWLAAGHCDWLWLRRVPRVAHAQKNQCLAVLEGHPEWLDARSKALMPASVSLGFWVKSSLRSACLRHKSNRPMLAAWNADSDLEAPCLLLDATAVVTQSNGQVCILKLHHGSYRVSLAEAEALITPPLKTAEGHVSSP